MEKQPLPLPENFNPQTFMLAKVTENGVFHETRAGAGLAARLVANGTPPDLELAEKVLNVVLNCQERRRGPDGTPDPHYGNFFWMIEDDVVFDLNAVEFNLEHLIPMMIRHRDRLPPALQERVLEAIRLGLAEIARLDVLIAYSNIAVLDVVNTILGGELLGDEAVFRRGCDKLQAWMALTDQHGTPYEYNSPTYTAVVIRALHRLVEHVQDRTVAARARAAAARLGLSAALHIHPATGRWAGPHSRVYHPSVLCETPPEINLLREWVATGALPAWVETALSARPAELEVAETAFRESGYGIYTYHSPSFALGVSAREYGGQSDVVMAHYVRPGAERAGSFYTRYLLNDKWLGDFYHQTDRTKSRNLIEEGNFYGVQSGPRALGMYTLPNSPGVISSAKAALIWVGRALVDEIWVGEERVADLPAAVPAGAVVVVGSGLAWFAVRPLARTPLGREAPARLVEKEGDLVLELYNYQGPAKPFWELNWPGAFYQGRPQCGFYLEMAERSAYPDGRALAREVARTTFRDESDPPFVYTGAGERRWRIEASRDGHILGLEVDRMAWKLQRRWTETGEIGWPMLESGVARQSRAGRVEVGGASLSFGPGAGWLYACPQRQVWAAGFNGEAPAPVTLRMPGTRVEIKQMLTGVIVWQAGQLSVDAVGLRGEPCVYHEAINPSR